MADATYRVTSSKPEEIHTGATFAPGEEVPGLDPKDPFDADKLERGLISEVKPAKSAPSKAKSDNDKETP